MKTDILIIGAGFAGASTAYHLSRSFSGSITILEKEDFAGIHASGRNASMVLQSVSAPELRPVLYQSRQAYERRRQEIGFQQTGSLLLGPPEQLQQVRQPDLITSRLCTPRELVREISLLEGHRFETGLKTPSDGVIDIAALLQFYLGQAQAANVNLQTGCEVREIVWNDHFTVRTQNQVFESGCVVNAAGAWAAQVGELAGAAPLPLVAYKRHLFLLSEVCEVQPDWPLVWSLDKQFYFRPESGDLLFSVCDEAAENDLTASVDPEVSECLAELIWSELPAMREAVQKRVWSCFRTRTPDGLFTIGWDTLLERFFWVAGLGGHGMGASWEIGRMAAERLLGRVSESARAFDPARFQHLTLTKTVL